MKVQLDRRGRVEADLPANAGGRCATSSMRRTCRASIGRKKRALYEPLLPYVNHRADLTYVIGEMIGELNIGHAYVRRRRLSQARGGSSPACWAQDRARSRPRAISASRGSSRAQNWDPQLRSPLTEIGVNVKEGDYILAVDGKPTNEMKNIYAALVDTAGKQVTLPRESPSR